MAASAELTTKEAADLAGVSARSIRAWLAAGHIQAVARLDGRRVTRQSLLAYLARREGHSDAAATPEAEAEETATDPAATNAVVLLVLAHMAAEREAAREEREVLRRENRDLAIQLGRAQGQVLLMLQSGAAAKQEASAEAEQPVRQPWWRRIFRGGSQ